MDGLGTLRQAEHLPFTDFREEPLFEPFRSRKPQGTGLGLFLSRTFMRRFDGDIRLVDSRPGEGSCFEIVFHRMTEVE